MAKYKIEFDKEKCIGAFVCNAVAAEFWSRGDDSKSHLEGSTYNEETKKWELIIDEKDLAINQEAESMCPVDVITITKIED